MATEQGIADADARAAALDPQRSFIVQAPAGSGKTELLTQRYLKLLALVDEPEEIMAITFTRKAAAEMRDRILLALRRGSSDEAPTAAHEHTTWTLARAALARDRERGWQVLAHPTRLRVETIDALNGMLTRQMPLLSGYGQQPAIEERPATLYREAAQRCLLHLEDAGSDWSESVGRLLLHLDNRFDRLTELLVGLLASRDLWLGHVARRELDRTSLEAGLRREVEHQLQRLDALLPASLRDELQDLLPRLLEYAERDAVEIPGAVALAELDAWPAPAAERLQAWQALAGLLLKKDGEPRKTVNKNLGFPSDDKAHKGRMLELLAEFSELPALVTAFARLRQLPPASYSDEQWETLAVLAEVLPLAVAELQLVFAERGAVDFAEMAQRARQALGEPDDPTPLALYLDHRISHLLVDEFQDTSQAQVELLERLTAGWMPDENRSLFLVGDPMQSIYRFREAEVGLFLKACAEGLGNLPLQVLRLSTNFRSSAGIVGWVNHCFSKVFPAQEDVAAGAVTYSHSTAFHPAADGAAVQLHPAYERNDVAEAEQVVELLRDFDASRPADESLAVLVRARGHLAEIIPALRRAGLPFQAVELESLGHLPAVADILALTRALQSDADRTAWLSLLRSPACGLQLAELERIAAGEECIPQRLRDETVISALPANARACLERVLPVLQRAEQCRGRWPLHQRVEACWLALGYPATLAAAEDIENARLALKLLRELEESGEVGDVNDFADELEALYAVPDPEAGSRVQLMTLHKAKGLEFDTVILPGLGKAPRGDDPQLLRWLERPRSGRASDLLLGPLQAAGAERDPVYGFIGELQQEQDELEQARLLYVGATRARRELHLFGHVKTGESRSGPVMREPARRSPLACLWPVLAGEFEQRFEPPPEAAESGEQVAAYPLRRLPADWQAPAWPASVLPPPAQAAEGERPIYEWAGDTARHVGTVVHRCLERLAAGEELLAAGYDPSHALRDLGVPESELAAATARVSEALQKVQSSSVAAQLLRPDAEAARNEWPLSAVLDGELVNVTLDRSYVDEQGRRWIVDYKTSFHEGGDLEGFLAEEQQRYRPQLERYARILRQLESRPIRLALYFPLHDRLLEWDPEA